MVGGGGNGVSFWGDKSILKLWRWSHLPVNVPKPLNRTF